MTARAALDVKDQVAREQRGRQRQHRQVAPVAPRRDLAADHRDQRRQKRQVHRRRHGDGRRRRQHRRAPRRPCQRQRGQRRAGDRQPPGPVRHSGQQESRHHGGRVAEQHLVDVPRHRVERARRGDRAGQHRQPQRHRRRRPDRRAEKQRAKAEAEQRRAAIGAQLLGGAAHGAAGGSDDMRRFPWRRGRNRCLTILLTPARSGPQRPWPGLR